MSFATRAQRAVDRGSRRYGNGRKATLQRYTETRDTPTGTTTRVEDGAAVVAGVVVSRFEKGEVDGLRSTDRKLILSGKDVGSDPPVDGSWTVVIDGGREIPLVMPITAVNPDGTTIAWMARMREGST